MSKSWVNTWYGKLVRIPICIGVFLFIFFWSMLGVVSQTLFGNWEE